MKFVNENSGITHRLFPTNDECVIHEKLELTIDGKQFRFEHGSVHVCSNFVVEYPTFVRIYVDGELSAFYWAYENNYPHAGYWDVIRLINKHKSEEK